MAEISLGEYCTQIEDLITQARYAEAAAHAKHILKQYPKCVAAYRLLGKTMLEARQSEYAKDLFLRVLSADPEDMLAWVALSELHDQAGELDAALWHLERAFELAADNKLVEDELRQLYGRRDGAEPSRIPLTRGALARLYLKGGLLPRAISEFRALLAEDPDRVDLEVALAEALWRNEQRLEASEVCQSVLDKLPYCLKANLILGEIWTNSGREEGEVFLRRAEALDPENRVAQEILGAASPLLPQEVEITPLDYGAIAGEERPAWMAAGVPPLTEREAALVDITAALEAQIEIPEWLAEIGGEGEAPEAGVPGFVGLEGAPAEATVGEEAAVPDWLTGVSGVGVTSGEEAAAQSLEQTYPWGGTGEETMKGEPVPDWLAEVGKEPVAPGEGFGWLSGLQDQSPKAEAEKAPAWLEGEGMPSGEEALAWLEGLVAGKEEELMARAEAEGEARAAEIMGRPAPSRPSTPELSVEAPAPAEIPDWLKDMAPPGGGAAEAKPAEPVPAEIPDWLQGLAPPEAAAPPAPAPLAESEAAPVPAWLEGEGMPSGEEALAWLERLAAGKEEELAAQAEAEAEARLAEILGRPQPAQPSAPPPPAAEAFGWVGFGAPEAPPEAVSEALGVEAPVEEAPSEAFAWTPVSEGAPPPEEAVGWGVREEEEELPAPVAGAEEAQPAPQEAFGWLGFGAAEAPVEAAPAAEEIHWGEALDLMFQEEEKEAAPPSVPPPPPAPVVEAPPPVEPVCPPPTVERVATPRPAAVERPPRPAAVEKPPRPAAVEKPPRPAAVEKPPRPAAPSREKPAPPKPPRAAKAPAAPKPLAAEQAYLAEHPHDYEAWLNLARALWQVGEREESLEAYGRVIGAGKYLDVVIVELEEYLEQWPDVRTQRVLGDAYMRAGRVAEALALYRRALETL